MRTALLVDRHADTRQMYGDLLRRFAWDIDEAQDGGEALAKALARPPDVVVTETSLPVISGLDLCRLLRNDALTRNVVIIIVSADLSDGNVQRARQSGADSVLAKPCLPQTLANEITRLLTNSDDLRARARDLAQRSATQFAQAHKLIDQVQAETMRGRVMLSRTHRRGDTTEPPTRPPALICPVCDLPLKYVKSHLGGVSIRHPEQWDYFECSKGCGMFQYRQRTHKVRHVA